VDQLALLFVLLLGALVSVPVGDRFGLPAPVLMTTSHTPRSQISRARDCGANIIIKKPFPPITVLERIIWSSKEGRKFLFSDTYVGPDRRFRNVGPPKGEKGRRREDFTATPLPQGQAAEEGEAADIEGGAEASGD